VGTAIFIYLSFLQTFGRLTFLKRVWILAATEMRVFQIEIDLRSRVRIRDALEAIGIAGVCWRPPDNVRIPNAAGLATSFHVPPSAPFPIRALASFSLHCLFHSSSHWIPFGFSSLNREVGACRAVRSLIICIWSPLPLLAFRTIKIEYSHTTVAFAVGTYSQIVIIIISPVVAIIEGARSTFLQLTVATIKTGSASTCASAFIRSVRWCESSSSTIHAI